MSNSVMQFKLIIYHTTIIQLAIISLLFMHVNIISLLIFVVGIIYIHIYKIQKTLQRFWVISTP